MKHKRYQVILADDDDDDRLLVGSLFRQYCADCEFLIAQDGQALIDLIEAPDAPATPLILLDLNMPVLNGFGALRYLKTAAHLRHIPVVILTTSEDPDDVNQSYALGANAFLTKPASHHDLKEMVLHLRDFWLKLARLPDGNPASPTS